jgi:type IV pilus biogenesis protein CpaD/CtpE
MLTQVKGTGTTVAKHTRMKSTALKFVVLVSFTLALIGCASQPAMTTTTTTQTTKQPLAKEGNGLASAVH